MVMQLKYRIYNFLDHLEAEDYLDAVHRISESFQLDFDEAESYVRQWYGEERDLVMFYETMKKTAELYNKKLDDYRTIIDFWTHISTDLDSKFLELLLLIAQDTWFGEAKDILLQRKMELMGGVA